MISDDLFRRALAAVGRRPNEAQQQVLDAPQDATIFVAAGPGTGKTACLAMRILKLVYVDGIAPRGILATTFTKKAAAELRSRILSWGYGVHEYLLTEEKLPKMERLRIERIDINQVSTGTIDSICEELLRDFRDPGADPPVLADEFVSKTLLLRAGLFSADRYLDGDLDQFLCDARGTGKFGWNLGTKNDLMLTIWDRRHHDQIDWQKFTKGGGTTAEKNARNLMDAALTDYAAELSKRMMVDFAQLEQAVLDRLKAGGFGEFVGELRTVLVDEYQDTNLLQESMYFELVKRSSGALTVVGDDDQSLYRFRGATVDLFSEFETRCAATLGRKPKKIFLNANYRSTTMIIDFVSAYAELDTEYQKVRVAGKPKLVNPKPPTVEVPILGMFRDTLDDLASDLAKFIRDVTRGGGFRVGKHLIKIDKAKRGNVGDCALLCSSPQEYGSGDPPKSRLPLRLKDELDWLTPTIPVFNPRGQDFTAIPAVRRLGGLLLCCLDRYGEAEDKVRRGLGAATVAEFQTWATEVEDDIRKGKLPKRLCDFVDNWSKRNPLSGYRWPKSTPCIDLLYALVHWMPELYNNPEGQVYLEVFTRQLGAAEQVSGYKARVIYGKPKAGEPDHALISVGHLLLYFLAPIAAGTAKVDEELIESFPRDRLNVLSIHQSKGLEFPLVIVDVGSDFPPLPKCPKGHYRHAFKRFPVKANTAQNLEDLMRPYSALAVLDRNAVDRSFDDLYRQFFVAFSRPKDVLLLVGLNSSKPGTGTIRNVATGWDRYEVNRWQLRPPFVNI
jgi:DNA helicase-2/ATP-dependent DNA helicase PcrA